MLLHFLFPGRNPDDKEQQNSVISQIEISKINSVAFEYVNKPNRSKKYQFFAQGEKYFRKSELLLIFSFRHRLNTNGRI